ncbi:hypothetical protein LCGC14_3125660, partial [marine sediment metagenome]
AHDPEIYLGKEEEQEDSEDMILLIQLEGTQAIATFNGVYKLQGLRSDFIAYFYPDLKVDILSQGDWDSIPDAHSHAGGSSDGLKRGDKVTLE